MSCSASVAPNRILHIASQDFDEIHEQLTQHLPPELVLKRSVDTAAFIHKFGAPLAELFPFWRRSHAVIRHLLVLSEHHALSFDCSHCVMKENDNLWLKVTWNEREDENSVRLVRAVTESSQEWLFATWSYRDSRNLEAITPPQWCKRTHTRLLLLKAKNPSFAETVC